MSPRCGAFLLFVFISALTLAFSLAIIKIEMQSTEEVP
jgi:hypothetical protein